MKKILLSLLLGLTINSYSQTLPSDYSLVNKEFESSIINYNIKSNSKHKSLMLNLSKNPYDYDVNRRKRINIIGGTIFSTLLTLFTIEYIKVYKSNKR
jgi:hypothetical protein